MKNFVKDSSAEVVRKFKLQTPPLISQNSIKSMGSVSVYFPEKDPFVLSGNPDNQYFEVQKNRFKYLSPSLSTFQAFKKPFYPKAARMQYLWDYSGKPYLDCLAQNLTISVGHNHPHVIEAAKTQMDKMVHCTTMYYNDSPIETAKKIVEKCLPQNMNSSDDDDWVVHFVNSGSEAIDLALMMARAYTGNWDIIALRNAYHGLHSTAMAVTGMSVCKQDIPHSFGIKHVMNPDMLRGPFSNCNLTEEQQVEKYVDDIEKTLDYETAGTPAAFLFEQVQGYGGIHILPDGYVANASKLIKERGGLIIADEVQSGFGRMANDTFWSFELDKTNQIYPDIIVTAKGIGNGFPIAAVMTRRNIADSITHKQFFNTYGGNPLVCAASGAVIDIVTSQKHLQHVAKVGAKLENVLNNIKDKYECVGDVRGKGLMHGIEITHSDKTPNKEKAIEVFEEARDQGLIMGKGGFYGNVLRVMPPMCIQEHDIDFIDQVLNHSLQKFE